MRTKIITHQTFEPDMGVRLDSVSATVPDKSLTPKQVRERYARGQKVQGTARPIVYDEGQEIIPDFTAMQIDERLEWLSNRRKELEELGRKLSAEARAVKEAEEKEDEARRIRNEALDSLLQTKAPVPAALKDDWKEERQ